MKWKDIGADSFVEVLRKSKDIGQATNALSELLGKRVTVSAIHGAIGLFRSLGADIPSLASFFEPAENEDEPEHIADMRVHRAEADARDIKRKYKAALAELENSERRLEHALAIQRAVPELVIKPHGKRDRRQATAVACASDWHLEERVDPAVIGGKNLYNPEVAEARAGEFFRGLLWKLQAYEHTYSIDHLVLWLGGDLISGYIHDELEESNYMTPLEASLFMKRIVLGGLAMLTENTGVDITVVTSHGNHGRMHKKPRISTAAVNNIEWQTYCVMRDQFENDERVTWQITKGAFNYVKIYDWSVRFTHGDLVRYSGGVGGIGVPMIKAVHRWNASRHADLTVMGHFHQRQDFGHILVNGSLIGMSAYSEAMGFAYEPPEQLFFLMDAERGKTDVAPIWVERSAKRASR